MHRALLVSLACFGVAIAVLVLDSAWGVEARLDAREDGTWRTVSTATGVDADPLRSPGGAPLAVERNGTLPMRVVVTNDRPRSLAGEASVTFQLYGAYGPETAPLATRALSLPAWGEGAIEFDLPANASASARPEIGKPTASEAIHVSGGVLVRLDSKSFFLPVAFEVRP